MLMVAGRGGSGTLIGSHGADNSNMEHVVTNVCSVKRQDQPLIDYFESLLERACHNHVYPIKHKLKDYGMMKSVTILGSLTQDMEHKEDLSRRHVMPFPREDVAMTVYDELPSP
jgi:hypothetical protein